MRPGHPFRIEGGEGHPAILVLVLGHDDDDDQSIEQHANRGWSGKMVKGGIREEEERQSEQDRRKRKTKK